MVYIRRRNVLFKRAKQLKTSASWLKYKVTHNKLVSDLRRAKKSHMEKLSNLSSNAKKFWSAVKKLSTSSPSIPTLTLDGSVASSESEKATMLNQFFSSCLNRSVPPLDISDTNRLQVDSDQCPPELLCSEEEITELLQTLDTSKASGLADVSTRMLRDCVCHCSLPYTVQNGVIPDEWKCSSIVPILKSSHKVLASIYRPTSLLSIVSKIFEKHTYNIIFAHVETYTHAISTCQSITPSPYQATICRRQGLMLCWSLPSHLLMAWSTAELVSRYGSKLVSYPGLLTPVFVACSTNVGEGLIKLIMCSDVPGCWVEEWVIPSVQLYSSILNPKNIPKTAQC